LFGGGVARSCPLATETLAPSRKTARQIYWALTAAIRFARPCLASAKYMPVLGLT